MVHVLPRRSLLTGVAFGALMSYWMISVSSQMKTLKAASSSMVCKLFQFLNLSAAKSRGMLKYLRFLTSFFIFQVPGKVEKEGFVRPDRIYAHIHIAKTAGTTLNVSVTVFEYEKRYTTIELTVLSNSCLLLLCPIGNDGNKIRTNLWS